MKAIENLNIPPFTRNFVACFHSQHFSYLEVFKISLVLLIFAITLKGINTLRGYSKDNRKSRYDATRNFTQNV